MQCMTWLADNVLRCACDWWISACGACGFKHTNQYPYMSMTSCGNQPLFKDGKGCGACYQVLQQKNNYINRAGV